MLAKDEPTPTLYEWAGGEHALRSWIDAFYDRVEQDDLIAMHNSQPGADVAEHAPVPRWGWGEAPPYQP